MADKIGSLIVSLQADIARFDTDLKRATSLADSAMGKIQSSITGAMRAFGALGAGLSVAGFAAMAKQTIDAAAALDDLAEKTGASVESLSKFAGVARITGQDMGSVEQAMGKLSKSIVEAQDGTSDAARAFKAFGVEIKNSDGSLKNSGTLMAELAVAQQKFGDGAGKAAAFMQLLGKSGAEVIPFMNDYVRLSEQVGVTTAEQAAQAETLKIQIGLLGENFSRMVREAVLPLLPAFKSLMQYFADGVTKSGAFSTAANVLAGAFKGLATVAVVIVEAFKQVGIAIGSVVGAIVETAKGNFAQAWDILKMGGADMVSSIKASLGALTDIWTGVTPAITAATTATDKAALAFSKASSSSKKASDSYKVLAAASREASKEAELLAKYALQNAEALEEQRKAIADGYTAMANSIGAAEDAIRKYDEQTDAIGKTADALAELEIRRAAEVRDIRLMAGWGQQAIDIYDKQTAAIRRRLEVETAEGAKNISKQIDDQSDELSGSLADAIMRGFEDGKDWAKNFLDTLKNWFGQTILRPVIQAIVSPVAGGIAGLLGTGTASASGLGGLGSIGSWFGGGSGMYGTSFPMYAAGAAEPVSALAGGVSQLTGLGAIFGGLGSIASVALPVVGALAGIASLFGLFDKKPKLVSGQFQVGGGSFEDSISTASKFGQLGFADSNTMRFSGEEGAAFSKIIAQVLDAAASQMDPDQIASTAAKLNATVFEAMEGELTTEAFIKAYGADIMQQTVAVAFDELNPRLGELMRAFSGSIEEITAYAGELLQVNALIEDSATALGGIFAGFDVDDIIALSDAFGGLEKLLGGAADYINLFYTDAEKLELATSALQKQFADLGLQMPETNEDFRALVDALRNAEQPNLDLIAALIKLAPAFAQVTAAASKAVEEIKQVVTTIDLTPVTTTDFERPTYPRDAYDEFDAFANVDPANLKWITAADKLTDATKDNVEAMTDLQRLMANLGTGRGLYAYPTGTAAPGGSQTVDSGLTAALNGMSRQIADWEREVSSLQDKSATLGAFRSSLLMNTPGFASPDVQYAEALRVMTTASNEEFVGAAQDFIAVAERNAETRFEYLRDVGTASAQALGRQAIIDSQIEYYNVQISLEREILRTLGQIREDISGQAEETKATNIAIARNTGVTARQLSRWDGDGMPAERVL